VAVFTWMSDVAHKGSPSPSSRKAP
jgi:hypothetical protein